MTESLRFRLSGWRGPVLIAVSLQVAVPWWNLSFKSLQEAKAVYAEHYRSK
jgi:hypothetical protein